MGRPGVGKRQPWASELPLLCLFFNFLFCIGVYLINDVVMVSGGQQRGSATHTHEPILPQTPLPSRPPHHIEQSSLVLYSRSLLLSILNISCYSFLDVNYPVKDSFHIFKWFKKLKEDYYFMTCENDIKLKSQCL